MPTLCRSASCIARRRSPGSWIVSASVKSSQRPRACRAAVQMALALPVQPGSSLPASITVTPAKPRAISAVRSVEWSSTTISSQSLPSSKISSDWLTSDCRHAPRQSSSLRAGTITVSSISSSGSGWSKTVPERPWPPTRASPAARQARLRRVAEAQHRLPTRLTPRFAPRLTRFPSCLTVFFLPFRSVL